MKLDLVVSGVGGQGVVTFSRIIVRAALAEGFDAHYLTMSAASQLEGAVRSHIRIGNPAGPSARIRRGGADVVIGMDRLEVLPDRRYLASGGTLLVVDGGLIPLLARTGAGKYPSREDVERCYAPEKVVWIPVPEFIKTSGYPGLIGAVLLGSLAAIAPVVDRDHLVKALQEEKPFLADLETDAFFEGYYLAGGEESFRGNSAG